MQKLLKPLAALSLTLPLTACGTSTVGTDGSCQIFKPITWSRADTAPTRKEVVAHNKVYGAICK